MNNPCNISSRTLLFNHVMWYVHECWVSFNFPKATQHKYSLKREGFFKLTEFLLWIHKIIGVWTVTRSSQTYDYTIVFTAMTKSVNSAIGRSSTHAQQSMLYLVPLYNSGYVPCWHLYFVTQVGIRYVWTRYFTLKMRSSERKHIVRRCRNCQSFRGSNRYGEIIGTAVSRD